MVGDEVDGSADLLEDGLHGVHDLGADAVAGNHGALDPTLRVHVEAPEFKLLITFHTNCLTFMIHGVYLQLVSFSDVNYVNHTHPLQAAQQKDRENENGEIGG